MNGRNINIVSQNIEVSVVLVTFLTSLCLGCYFRVRVGCSVCTAPGTPVSRSHESENFNLLQFLN